MPRVSLQRKTRMGVKAIRVLVGMMGHRPSAYNACVGGHMRGQTFPSPGPGQGGLRNPNVHRAFVQAAVACGANISPAKRRQFGV